MALVNMMEIIARQKLDDMLENMDCCKCEKCYLDMLAYALNNLKPMYVNSKEGELFSKVKSMSYQSCVDIDVAVATAINIVASSPRHEKETADVPDDFGNEAV
ncbi:MAG: late competence development ComFB family protein [Oscillospiraceae bacterium]